MVVLMSLVVALGAALTAPVSAAPDPISLTYEVTCGSTEFTVKSPGHPPGWAGDLTGTTPSLFLGGHLALYERGEEVFSFDDPLPPGLVSRVETCVIVGPVEYAGEFEWVIDPAYILFTPHS
jgi:hypothetical protein